ncbi:MAG: hypothetical protein ACXWMX_03430, partial [Candidatus Limnocylindrales bacterium]
MAETVAPGSNILDPAPEVVPSHDGGLDSSVSRPAGRTDDEGAPDRARLVQRGLEIVPGLVSWVLILAPILVAAPPPIGFDRPELVAWFVLSFDFYWLYKAVVLCVSVAISFLRIRRVMAVDWRERTFALAEPVGRRDELQARIPAVQRRINELEARGDRLAARGGRR